MAPKVRSVMEEKVIAALFGGAWALNFVLLFSFVAPLYAPLDDVEFAAAVRAEAAEGEYGRASALYRLAVATFPTSTTLRRVVVETPLLSLSGGDDELLADFQARIGRGERVESRAELLALARAVRIKGWFDREALRRVLETTEDTPAVREPLAVIRAEVEGRGRDRSAAADVINAGGGVVAPVEMHGEAWLEGFTVYPGPPGHNDVTVYFRPLRDWSGRRLWLHIYPAGSHDYLSIDPIPPTFDAWKPGELSWEVFRVPTDTRYVMYVGVEGNYNLGPAYPLGSIGP